MQRIQYIQGVIGPVLRSHGVLRSSLFGSCARGEETEQSDIDLLVDLPKGTGMFGYMRLKRDLEAALGTNVDLVTYRSLHPLIKPYIERDMVPMM